jgi:hypothetical protein
MGKLTPHSPYFGISKIRLSIVILLLLSAAGLTGYIVGSKINPAVSSDLQVKSNLDSPASQNPLSGPVYPIDLPAATPTSISDLPDDLKINLSSTAELETGYPSSSEDVDVNLFLFADITEERFSGKTLQDNMTYLLDTYPKQIKIWYLNTALPYYDAAGEQIALTTLTCLANQQAVWPNIRTLVKEKRHPITTYKISDPMQQKFGVAGVPTVIIVTKKSPHIGIIIPGLLPLDVFKEKIEKILKE